MPVQFSTQCTANPGPPAPLGQTQRDLRIVRALRLRRDHIRDEMESCLRQREEAYQFADALLDEFDHLAATDKRLRTSLMQIELRLQRSGAYFISDAQVTVLLNEIADVGADIKRFCEYMDVAGIAKIPAHEFDEALAALAAKRRRRAAA